MILPFIILHTGIALIVFIIVFLFANATSYQVAYISGDWEYVKIKLKQRLKQDYFISKHSEYILVRLKFLDNSLFRNSIQVEPDVDVSEKKLLKFSARTDLRPFGFFVCLLLSFMFYFGALYLMFYIKKIRRREQNEMRFIANLSSTI